MVAGNLIDAQFGILEIVRINGRILPTNPNKVRFYDFNEIKLEKVKKFYYIYFQFKFY